MPRYPQSWAVLMLALSPLLLGARARAEAPVLSLDEALRLALKQNLDILAAEADVRAAEAQLETASQFQNPSLSLSVSKIPTDGTPASTASGNGVLQRSYDSVISLSQPLEIGGKRPARKLSAENQLAAARARLADARRQVSLLVVQASAALSLAEETRTIARATAGSLDESAALARLREQAGDISEAERDQIELAASRFRAEAAAAEAAVVSARNNLALLLGRQPSSGLAVEPLSTLVRPAEASGARTLAAASRPDVQAAELDVKKAEADLKLQKAQKVPDPTVWFQYEREPPDLPNTVGIGVSFPLPLWNHNRGGVKAAEAARDSARLSVARLQAKAEAEAEASRVNFEKALERSRTYREELVPKARKIRETVSFAYREGAASLLELLEVERNLNDVLLAQAASESGLLSAWAEKRTALALPLLEEATP